MRIDQLILKDFKNLKDVAIDFDETRERTVLVGRNGVGKTNLLEAITWIFRNLDLRERPEFGYRIVYQCNKHRIEIESIVEREGIEKRYKPKFRINRNEEAVDSAWEDVSEAEFYRINGETRILPRNIFGYYSGTSNRLEELFRKHEERYRDALIRGDNQTIRFLFWAKPEHSQFVLLAFYAKDDAIIRAFLQEQLRIEALDSVLFVLHEPYWNQNNPSDERKMLGDERFWYAGGKVKDLLNALYAKSLAPMWIEQRVPAGIRQTRSKEHAYCYLRNENDIKALAEGIDQKELFRRLESTQLSDLLHKLWIYFRVAGREEPLSFDDLSEGEQQLLTVLGLLRFTAEDESLFLLDEPDTHLNPAWCLDYLQILKDYGGGLNNSQVIMTTHSPIVFAGLEKEEVVVMHISNDGNIIAEHPATDPRGLGFSAILTSEYFGLRSILDRQTLGALEEKRRLARLKNRTNEEEERLLALNAQLRQVDISNMVRDPLYKEYVDAMTSKAPSSLTDAVLTSEELEQRRKLAKQIVEKLQS